MTSRIHPTAIVSSLARLGERVTIGPHTIVNDDVVLGDDWQVDAFCILGETTPASDAPLTIERGARIRSHSILYRGSTIGAQLTTGHYAVIREGSGVSLDSTLHARLPGRASREMDDHS